MTAPEGRLSADAIAGGVRAPRAHDSAAKHVAGRAAYVDDIQTPPGCLHLAFGLSGRARARLASVDLSAVRAAEGVVAVLTAADLPGRNDVSPNPNPEPLLAEGEVFFHGQPVFAVAATSHLAARRAARLARIEYENLPAILSVDQALAAESFLEPPYAMARGDAEAALARAPRRLSGCIGIGGQEHFYLEGQAALSIPGEDGDVTIHSSYHRSEE